jgi:FkbM family methyltransferase
MQIVHTIRKLLEHPLNRRHRFKALSRFVRWQIGSRLLHMPVAVPFTDHARLLVSTGMQGATGNYYCGLHEFEDMAFTMHLLRSDDLFVDVGANVGSYSVLAAKLAQARCIAVEPIASTFEHLIDNISLNRLQDHVCCYNLGLSSSSGELRFTSNLDTINHVVGESEVSDHLQVVPTTTLDDLLLGKRPCLIKIDVEGYESEVLAGGSNVLSTESLLAVIMELNGSGAHYGHDDHDLHKTITRFGFSSYSYDPFSRSLNALGNLHNSTGNTLYIRNINLVCERLASAANFKVFGESI